MSFASIEFGLFFVAVFALYCALPHRGQNGMLLVASYVFYAAWDWRFLSLILISTLVDYVAGIKIDGAHSTTRRKVWLAASLFANLGILGFFKYFDFFSGSVEAALVFTEAPLLIAVPPDRLDAALAGRDAGAKATPPSPA